MCLGLVISSRMATLPICASRPSARQQPSCSSSWSETSFGWLTFGWLTCMKGLIMPDCDCDCDCDYDSVGDPTGIDWHRFSGLVDGTVCLSMLRIAQTMLACVDTCVLTCRHAESCSIWRCQTPAFCKATVPVSSSTTTDDWSLWLSAI